MSNQKDTFVQFNGTYITTIMDVVVGAGTYSFRHHVFHINSFNSVAILFHVFRYYPHHYAPYISDISDFAEMEMNFDQNAPFKPFEQLLAVLPAASSDCLPSPYRVMNLKLFILHF